MTAVEICPLNAPGDFTVQIIAKALPLKKKQKKQ